MMLISKGLKLKTPQYISNIERGKCNAPEYVIEYMLNTYEADKEKFISYYLKLRREELEHIFGLRR